ncbi:hypothetical protein [Chlamydiifrater volucris]|uniref:hypothetical protein n=1 Tax=Chlamydiifrater volucris TaxID=2681470 RepID=UPI001BCAF970|nr:hypothetical protein [Chlamydiifrater volucris]
MSVEGSTSVQSQSLCSFEKLMSPVKGIYGGLFGAVDSASKAKYAVVAVVAAVAAFFALAASTTAASALGLFVSANVGAALIVTGAALAVVSVLMLIKLCRAFKVDGQAEGKDASSTPQASGGGDKVKSKKK